jgi:hypothetical protein
MHNLLRLFVLFTLFGLFTVSKSTAGSSIGGHISWNCVGQDSFIITATYYRDCNYTPLVNPIVVVSCSTSGDTLATLNLPSPSYVDVTPTCATSCNRCLPPYNCTFPYGFSKYTSSKLVVLSNAGSCCSINLNFNAGQRPTNIITTGAAYQNLFMLSTFNRCIGAVNSSPTFESDPVFLTCIGQDQIYQMGAKDTDKDSAGNLLDSLSYELIPSLTGPASAFVYSGAYTYNKPIYFWGFPNKNLPKPRGFHLDNFTGNIYYQPMKIEGTPLAVKIKQWRRINGVMTTIAEQNREYTIIVISCSTNYVPEISANVFEQGCAGDTLQFTITTDDNNTSDSVFLHFDNSIANAKWTTSNHQEKHPTGILKIPTHVSDSGKTGSFFISATDNACPLPGKQIKQFYYTINGPNSIALQLNKTDLGCGNFELELSPYNVNYQYVWKSTQPNSTDIAGSGKKILAKIINQGNYPFRIDINNSCKQTYFDNLAVNSSTLYLDLPETLFMYGIDSSRVLPQIKNMHGNLTFQWSDLDVTNLNKWFHFKDTMVQEKVFLSISDTTNCTQQDSIIIVYDSFIVNCGNDIYKCSYNTVTLKANYEVLNQFSSAKYFTWYKKGNPTPLGYGNTYSTKNTGLYICEVELHNGLKKKDTIELFNYPLVHANAGNDTLLCSDHGLYELVGTPIVDSFYWSGTAISEVAGKYYFDPRDGSITNGSANRADYQIVDQYGCASSDYKYVRVYFSSLKPTIEDVPELCENSGVYTMKADISSGYWSGPSISGDLFNTNVSGSGVHQILYWVGNSRCKSYDTTYITVKPKPNIKLKTEYGINNFCKEYGLIEITPKPAGGTLTGPLYQDYFFNADTSFGSYSFLYSITDTSYCQVDSETIVLNVGQTELKIVNNDSFCQYKRIQLSAHDSFTSGIEWMADIGSNGHFSPNYYEKNVTYFPDSNELSRKWFNIKIKTTDTICLTVWDSMFIRIIDLPEADFDKDPAYYDSSLNQYFVQFYNRSIIPDGYEESYLWHFGEGKTSTEENPLHAYNRKDQFTVSLLVITNYGCPDSTTKFDFVDLFLANQEITKGKIELFPNPSSNSITLTSDIQMQELSLYNSLGELIEQVDIKEFNYVIKRQLSGMYYLKITDINHHIYMEKIIFR